MDPRDVARRIVFKREWGNCENRLDEEKMNYRRICAIISLTRTEASSVRQRSFEPRHVDPLSVTDKRKGCHASLSQSRFTIGITSQVVKLIGNRMRRCLEERQDRLVVFLGNSRRKPRDQGDPPVNAMLPAATSLVPLQSRRTPRSHKAIVSSCRRSRRRGVSMSVQ
ncbi:uncharacterized protein LOC116848181 [Odontomachus brunneus]|uniref:uncharacterized protein LOC116848181 n=1 Tax=Odontomachus brunneus TaxID=486640 RepID=UPI0013F2AD0F|nr:uncharacterized protein LOC116848181 [Odontomachus brunneus]